MDVFKSMNVFNPLGKDQGFTPNSKNPCKEPDIKEPEELWHCDYCLNYFDEDHNTITDMHKIGESLGANLVYDYVCCKCEHFL